MTSTPMFAVALASLLACSGQAPASSTSQLDGRTYTLKVPAGYDGSKPLPLIVALHAYASSGTDLESYFQLDPIADEQGFFVVYPDGTVDAKGNRFFSATDACCDFFDTGVDDVAFIGALLDRLESTYAIDTTRVYATGHSNGGFMSHRLACDLSSRFAAVVSLEGAAWNDPSHCTPGFPVAVVEVHGTDDTIILPAGGDVVDGYTNRVYPPLTRTIGSWATLEGCDGTGAPGADPGTIDGETSQPSTTQVWSGCKADVELWLNQGGTHVPKLTPAWPRVVTTFLLAHARIAPE
jgi:polyhydroxybutyrate depolymerase